jgi:hypothetical protein
VIKPPPVSKIATGQRGFWDNVLVAVPFWENGGVPHAYTKYGIVHVINSFGAGCSWANSRFGPGFKTLTAGSVIQYGRNQLGMGPTSDRISMLMLMTQRSSETGIIFHKHNQFNAGFSYRFQAVTAGTIAFSITGQDGLEKASGNSAALTAGLPQWFLGRWQSGGAPELRRYDLAGVQQEAVTGTTYTGTFSTDPANGWRFGASRQEFAVVYAWPEYIPDGSPFLRQFFADPWWPFRPLRRRVYGKTSAITAALSGTALAGITEADIRAGGKTIVIDLVGSTFIP